MGLIDTTKPATDGAAGADTSVNAGAESREDLLIRQVEIKVAQEGKHTDTDVSVDFMKLLEPATGGEKCKIYLGWSFAAITGSILPFFFFFIGPIFDAMGSDAGAA